MLLLATNVVSAVMQNRPDPGVVRWLDPIPPDQIWLPSVVVFELRSGLEILLAGSRRRRLEESLQVLLVELVQGRIALLDALAAREAARLAARSQTLGTPDICATP